MLSQNGKFNITTGAAGSTVKQTFSFQPKVIFFTWSGNTSLVNDITQMSQERGFGVAMSTTKRACIANHIQNGVSSTNSSRRKTDAACIAINNVSSGADEGSADLQSLDTDGFTLVIDTQFLRDISIEYFALGGSDVIDADVGFISNSSAGATSLSVTGLSFQPNFCGVMDIVQGAGTVPYANSEGRFIMGMASGPANEFTLSHRNYDNKNPSINIHHTADTQIGLFGLSTGTYGYNAITSLSSFNTDGMTFDFATTGNNDQSFLWYALNCTNVDVQTINTKTDTTDIAVTGLGYKPAGFMFFSSGNPGTVYGAVEHGDSLISVGFAKDETSRGLQATFDEDNVTPSNTATVSRTDAVYAKTNNAGAITALMDLKSVDADGFTTVMDIPDSTALNEVYVVTFGPAEAGAIDSTAPTYSVNPAVSSFTNVQIVVGATASDETDTIVNHYAVVVANGATAPSPAQVKAGQDSTGAAAISSGSDLAVSNGVAGSITLVGLVGNIAYDIYYCTEDTTGNLTAVTLLNQTTQSAALNLTIAGAPSKTINGVLFDGLTNASPGILKPAISFTTAADTSATLDLNDVVVTDSQALEGIGVESVSGDPVPIKGTVSIA